jgi:hypothetical protein
MRADYNLVFALTKSGICADRGEHAALSKYGKMGESRKLLRIAAVTAKRG